MFVIYFKVFYFKMNVCIHKHIEHLEEFIQNRGYQWRMYWSKQKESLITLTAFFFFFKNSGILSAHRYEVFGIFEIKKMSIK